MVVLFLLFFQEEEDDLYLAVVFEVLLESCLPGLPFLVCDFNEWGTGSDVDSVYSGEIPEVIYQLFYLLLLITVARGVCNSPTLQFWWLPDRISELKYPIFRHCFFIFGENVGGSKLLGI